MRALMINKKTLIYGVCALGLSACGGGGSGSSNSVTVEGNVAIAYVKRPVTTLGNPTDSITFTQGGDLYTREKSSPTAPEVNITASMTNGRGDVSDPEVSYDGTKILFAMRCTVDSAPQCYGVGPSADDTWNIWEYDIRKASFRKIIGDPRVARAGDDVDPAYLPDGRIVFVSTRQEKSKQQMTAQGITPYSYLDEYEREPATTLHVMDSNGTNIHQISFNQSHDRNPSVILNGQHAGEIMYSRWDHVGERNQFSIFTTNPDGTNLFVLYGAHSPGNSYLHPREMPDGRVISTLMPLSRTREGGALMLIDVADYSENTEPAPGVPAGGSGQYQPTEKQINYEEGVSRYGRYSTPYPLWDGSPRGLVSWTPSQPKPSINSLTSKPEQSEDTPVYGVYMFNMEDKTLKPVVLAPPGYAVLDAVAIQPRPLPNVIADKTPDPSIKPDMGILNVKSVYDTDTLGRMGRSVLTDAEKLANLLNDNTTISDNIRRLKDPLLTTAAKRPARFVRITKAVPTPPGISRETIGETEFEMQQIVGYTEVEPDGSFRIEVPADTPLAIAVLDADGRAFTPHTSWIQVRPGETRTCNGCHSPRRANPLNAGALAGNHPNTVTTLVAAANETMAETRTRLQPSNLKLKPDIEYQDIWTNPAVRTPDSSLNITYSGLGLDSATPAGSKGKGTPTPSKGVINYPDHIQPLWTKDRGANTCTTCHSDTSPDPISRKLDLSTATAGSGRLVSYDELLIGDPELDAVTKLPIIDVVDNTLRVRREPPQVVGAESRASHLIEVLYNTKLRSARALPVAGRDHSGMLNASEKRLVTEWVDLGAQYYNSPFDSAGAVRGVATLSESDFARNVHPILKAKCLGCHQPFGGNGSSNGPVNPLFVGNRFVLTGQARGDFNVTVSMVNQVTDPATTQLLRRPLSNGVSPNPPHSQLTGPTRPVLSNSDADYKAICNWIKAGACP